VTARREARCTWIAPSEAARLLVPGCWTRVQDWDADCTCKTTTQELDEADARIADLERQLQQSLDEQHAMAVAIGRHTDRAALFEAATKFRIEWRRQQAAAGRDEPDSKEIPS
jgi:hypothetical protein